MKFFFLLLLAAVCLLTGPAAVAQTPPPVTAGPPPTAAQYQAAEALLTTLQVDKVMAGAIDQLLTTQLQQNTQLRAVEPEMRAFFAKYMSWPAVKEDLVLLYARAFSAAELKDVNQFYQTPTGQKFISQQVPLMQQSMLIGQQRVQAHLPELKQAIEDKLKAAAPTPN